MNQEKINRYLRVPHLLELTGLSKSTIWRMERKGTFPKKRQLSPNCVGWLEAEVQAWLASRDVVVGGV